MTVTARLMISTAQFPQINNENEKPLSVASSSVSSIDRSSNRKGLAKTQGTRRNALADISQQINRIKEPTTATKRAMTGMQAFSIYEDTASIDMDKKKATNSQITKNQSEADEEKSSLSLRSLEAGVVLQKGKGLVTSRSFNHPIGASLLTGAQRRLPGSTSFTIQPDRKQQQQMTQKVEKVEKVAITSSVMKVSPSSSLTVKPASLCKESAASVSSNPVLMDPLNSNLGRPSDSHLSASEYAADIMKYLLENENRYLPSSDYMSRQPDLNTRMREILIDYLHDLSYTFQLQHETVCLTINIIDRFLSLVQVQREKLQLVGCVALFLAAKYEETSIFEISDLVHLSGAESFTADEVKALESSMLNTLKFNLSMPLSTTFLDQMINISLGSNHSSSSSSLSSGECMSDSVRLRHLSHYLLHITFQHYRFLIHRRSILALATWFLVVDSYRPAHIPQLLLLTRNHYKCPSDDLSVCITAIYDSWLQQRSDLRPSNSKKYRAVTHKFAHSRFGGVSKLRIKSPASVLRLL